MALAKKSKFVAIATASGNSLGYFKSQKEVNRCRNAEFAVAKLLDSLVSLKRVSDLDRLEGELRAALAAATNRATTQLFLGIGCHPDIVKLSRAYGALISPVKNCLEAFLGAKMNELEEDGTMIMTPGWIRVWPGMMAAMGWNEVDVRINYGRYNRILVVDPGISPLSDEEILEFFDLIQIPIEIQPLELDHFKSLLTEMIG